MEKRYIFETKSNIKLPTLYDNSKRSEHCDLEEVLEKLYMFENVPFTEVSVTDKITNETYKEPQTIIDFLNSVTPIYRAVVFINDLNNTSVKFFCTYQSLETYLNSDIPLKRIELYNFDQKSLVCYGNPITFMSKLKTVLEMSDPLVDINTCVPPEKRVEFDLHEGFTKLSDMIKNGGDSTEMLELLTVLKYFSTKKKGES